MQRRIMFLFLLASFLVGPTVTQAQISFTFAEWFKQKKTQKKYLLKQIAELQLYLSALKKGYDIAQDGLGTIRAIRKGEFDLHDLYYLSLKNVSPAIRQYPAGLQAIQRCQATHRFVASFLAQLGKETTLAPERKFFMEKTCQQILAGVDSHTDQLSQVLTSGKLQLTDDERITRLEKILSQCQDQYRFAHHFCNDARLYVTTLHKENAEITTLKGLYHLKD